MNILLVFTNVGSENRYKVKIPGGDTLYIGNEASTNFQRCCFGSSRSYTMRLFDRTQQEAMEFKRRLACGNCPFMCYLQESLWCINIYIYI